MCVIFVESLSGAVRTSNGGFYTHCSATISNESCRTQSCKYQKPRGVMNKILFLSKMKCKVL